MAARWFVLEQWTAVSERTPLERRETTPVLVVDPTATATQMLTDALGERAVRRVADVESALDVGRETTVCCLVYPFAELSPGDRERIQQVAECPILALVSPPEARAALGAGATDVLDPGADPAVVRARVRTVLKGSEDVIEGAEKDRSDERQRTASSLESADIARRFLESGPIAWLRLGDGNTVIAAGAAIEPTLGRLPSEIQGQRIEEMVNPADRSAVRQTVDAVSPHGRTQSTAVARFRHADGSWIRQTVTAIASPKTDADGEIESDTDGKIDLVLSPAAAPPTDDLVHWVESVDRPALAVDDTWNLVAASRAASSRFEPGRADATLWDVLPARIRERFSDSLKQCRQTESPVRFTTPRFDKQGETERSGIDHAEADELEWLAAPTSSGVMAITLTSATPAEPLQQSRTLETVVDALGIGVLLVDRNTGHLQAINEAGRRLLGPTDGEHIGQSLEALIDDRTRERVHSRTAATPVGRAGTFTATVHTADGDRTLSAAVVSVDADRYALGLLDGGSPTVDTTTVSTLAGVAHDVRTTTRPSRLAAIAADGVLQTTPSSAVGVYLREGDRLHPAAVKPSDSDPPLSLPTLETVTVPALDPRELIGPAMGLADSTAFDSLFERVGLHTEHVLLVPLGDQGIVFATGLGLRTLDPVDVDALSILAAVVTDRLETLENARNRDGLENRLEGIEAQLDRQRELEAVVTTIDERMAAGSNREHLESAICDDLAALTWVTGVWIGSIDLEDGQYRTRATAGGSVSPFVDGRGTISETDVDSLESVVGSRTVTVEQADTWTERDAGIDRPGQDGDGDTREERGGRVVASLPLVFDERQYGVLALAITDPPADSTLTGLEALRTTLTLANALEEYRQFVTSEDRLELEFALPAHDVTEEGADRASTDRSPSSDATARESVDDPLIDLAVGCRCRVDLLTLSHTDSGASAVLSLGMDDGELDRETVGAALEDIDGLEGGTLSRSRGDRLHLETAIRESNIGSVVGTHGGKLTRIDATDHRPRIVIDVAPGTSIRTFADRLEKRYPDIELRSKRVVSAESNRDGTFSEHLREQLTDRQLETLRVTYHAGYFEWPRDRTGGEVAELLDVSQPTFTRHLRTAERKLFELLFEEGWLE
ncbi:helix-turn-helix domain-containing protein [Natronosalvus vescus]|uniref:helix-turn-helix domain-containing protein n=1 Tax=Natronosalvus vescus TaxID=2953881 RepID=UPI00209026EC|nr:helix-turn-helix domain-containing protein [Natronosalvus vescus]